MSAPIKLPRSRSYRDHVLQNLPHPGYAVQLCIEDDGLVNGNLYVLDLSVLGLDNTPKAREALLELLRDCLTKGYQSATADMRRLIDHGK